MKNFQNKAKIIKVSKVLRKISLSTLLLLGLTIIVFLGADILLWGAEYFKYSISISDTDISAGGEWQVERLWLFFNIPILVCAFQTNRFVFLFFDRLKNGCFFDAQTVVNLNKAGTWLLVLWLYEVASHISTQVFYGDHFTFKNISPQLGTLLAGLILKFFAWLFREAQELQEEQELTV